MAGNFDFAPNRHTWVELPPQEQQGISFRGWDFAAKPAVPYRPKWKLTLYGMRWYLNSAENALDLTTNPTFNAGRLLLFYRQRRQHETFSYNHQVFGTVTCRFAAPLEIPGGMGNSNGLIEPFEVQLLHHNPPRT